MSNSVLSRGVAVAAMLGVAVVYGALGFVGGTWFVTSGYSIAAHDGRARVTFTAKPGERPTCGQEIMQ